MYFTGRHGDILRLRLNLICSARRILSEPQLFLDDRVSVYRLHPQFKTRPNVRAEGSLVTVVAANQDRPVSSSWLKEYLARMEECGVYRKCHFFEGSSLTNPPRGQSPAADFQDYLRDTGKQVVGPQTMKKRPSEGAGSRPLPLLQQDTQTYLLAVR